MLILITFIFSSYYYVIIIFNILDFFEMAYKKSEERLSIQLK